MKISFLFLYLFSTVGIPLSVHSCSNSVSSVQLFFLPTARCGCEESACATDCCKDEIQIIQLSETQLPPQFQVQALDIPLGECLPAVLFDDPFSPIAAYGVRITAGEQACTVPLYLEYRTLLI